jgi:pyruvate formate lyase activating enzyme
MQDRPRTRADVLEKAYQIGKAAGLINVYVGNIQTNYQDTVCACGQALIKRQGYGAKTAGMEGGKCKKCGKACYGIFQ